jgi:hypothetical protein
MTTYYTTLGLKLGASAAEITAAYRKMSRQCHPDLNPNDPLAELKMKRINEAYAALTSTALTLSRSANSGSNAGFRGANAKAESAKRAQAVMEQYFTAIKDGDSLKAYSLISDYDKQYVTAQSFREWRDSVRRLFRVNAFSVSAAEHIDHHPLRKGVHAEAIKLTVKITEQNRVTTETDRYPTQKHCINEGGEWRVLLGYRDLNEIARVFENVSSEQESGEMRKHWDEYCAEYCRELGILSKKGFVKAMERETYRAKRFKHSLVAAVYKMPAIAADNDAALEGAADAVRRTLRLTDTAAYLGNGVFAALYPGLKKRNAALVTARLRERLSRFAPTQCEYEIRETNAAFDAGFHRLIGSA